MERAEGLRLREYSGCTVAAFFVASLVLGEHNECCLEHDHGEQAVASLPHDCAKRGMGKEQNWALDK